MSSHYSLQLNFLKANLDWHRISVGSLKSVYTVYSCSYQLALHDSVLVLTCCPHFAAFTAPRFSVDKSKGAGSVMSLDDEGRGGGVKFGNGWAWKFS